MMNNDNDDLDFMRWLGLRQRRMSRCVVAAIVAAIAALALTYLILDKLWTSKHTVEVQQIQRASEP